MRIETLWHGLAALALSVSLTACVDGGSGSSDDGTDGGTGGAGGDMSGGDMSGGAGGGAPACTPGRTEACACPGGTMGVQTCEDDGTFGACDCPSGGDAGAAPDAGPECADGDTETEACADGGERSRACTDGAWADWGPCEGGACEGDDTETRECGLNDRGTSERACVDGTWAPWSACDDPDACADGSTEEGGCGLSGNGRRERTCEDGQWAEWGECADDAECVDGATERRACGLNGTGRQDRTCADGAWGEWAECDDPDECVDGDTEDDACGVEGNGTRSRACAGGRWGQFGPCDDPDRACDAGSIEEVPCGLNRRGRQSHECEEDGRWGDFTECEDPDVCVDEAVQNRACGLNGSGVEGRSCVEGQWADWGACDDTDECVNGTTDTRGCGLNGRGEESRECAGGLYGAWTECDDTDTCRDGTVESEACPGGDERTRRCVRGDWDEWGECGARPPCPDAENPACPPVRAERCNGIDDDADGAVDEGLAEPGDADEEDVLTPFVEDVNDALGLGFDWLRTQVEDDGSLATEASVRINSLAVMAFLGQRDQGAIGAQLGYDGIDAGDQALVQRVLAAMIDGNASLRDPAFAPHTYSTGTDIGALAMYLGTGGPDDVGAMVTASQALDNGVNALAATQAQQPPDNEGGWNYTSPGASADISTTHFAVSGMAAAAALNEVAALAVERSVPVLRRNFEVHGGAFGYRNAVNQAPSTSMTAAGVWMHLLAGTPPNDPDVTTALAWLAENYLPDGMVGPFEGTSNYYAMWTQAKAFTALGDFVEGIPGALNPVALGYADHPPGWWFDFSATLLGWQDVEGQWGTQANGSDRGWSQMSSHLFAILTLQKTLGLVPVAPDAGPPACFDGVDNDRDGLADDEDPDCAVACRPTERPLPTCSNFADDDGDGRADYPDDPGCTHPGDLDETSPACADGRDNDGDDRIDFPADPGCTGFRDDAEADPDGPAPACANGEDDDGDGETDFPADPDCVNARQDFESPERLCGDATVLGVLPAGASRLLGDTGDGENALAGECGGVAGREVVYALVADGPERVTLSTIDDDTLVDTVLFVRSACEDAETELACSDDVGDDPRSSATAILPEAGLYFVVVDARIGRGEFALNVTRTPIGGGLPACVDRADNDGDGRFDLVDPGCTAPGDDDETDPDEPPACSNGADDDDDGLADLEDPGCAAAGDDDEADPEEPPACSNGVDDDADGHTDWPADNGCLGPGGETEFGTIRARCNNGIDDDNDGAIDYPVDPGCIARTDDTEDSPARACGNEVDDDQDGVADYPFDPGCAAAGDADEADPDPLPACANGEDDDEDGATDYPFDPGCLAAGDDDEANAGVTRCSNGFDDDNDGAIDYPDDTGCSSAADDDEAGGGRNARCADGADNDGDGLRDAADPGCEDADDNDETDPVAVPECANQADDDNDGLVDWPEDPGCLAAGGTESHACVARQAQAVPAGGVFVANINQNTPDDYRHSCGGNGVGEQVYVYTLDAPASLLISADDPGRTLDPVISVRRTCEELRSEVGCGRPDAPEVVIPDAEAGEYYIFVSADVLTGVASSGEPIEMPAQPRVYNPRDDVNANCLSDGGNDAFDCYGRLTLFRGAASVVQDISPGEKQTVVDGVEYTLTTDFAAPGVYRYRIDGPPGETVGVGVAGNLGSDGGTNVETYEAAVGNTPVFYARTTDNLENPRDPPVYTMVVPSSPVDAGGAAYAFNGDNLTYSQAGLALPITIYIAWTYAEREAVEAAILSDLVELNGGDGVGAVEVTVEAR